MADREPDREADPLEAIVAQWAERLPALDASPLLVLGRIQRIAARVEPRLRPTFAKAGLAAGDFDVLAALRRSAPPHALTAGELAGAMVVTGGAVTKRVDRLASAGLVTRTRSRADGRGRVIALTTAGRRLTDRLIRLHLRNEAAILAALTPADRDMLGRLLGTLLVSLEPDSSA